MVSPPLTHPLKPYDDAVGSRLCVVEEGLVAAGRFPIVVR